MPSLLVGLTLEAVSAEGHTHTALYNRGSPRGHLLAGNVEGIAAKTGRVRTYHRNSDVGIYNLYSDPGFWTSAITFIAAWGRKRQ
jgi:hypothetical protein